MEEIKQNKIENALEILREPMALGEVFAESGIFKDTKTAAQAVVKILAGKEMGLSPIESMNNLFIVNDKIGVTTGVIASRIKKSGKYDFQVKVLNEKECAIEFSLLGEKPLVLGLSTFTFADCAKAGLANKDVWKNYPRNMMFNRALSNGAKWFCADIISYSSAEELQDIAPAKKTIEITAEGTVQEALPEVKEEVKNNG